MNTWPVFTKVLRKRSRKWKWYYNDQECQTTRMKKKFSEVNNRFIKKSQWKVFLLEKKVCKFITTTPCAPENDNSWVSRKKILSSFSSFFVLSQNALLPWPVNNARAHAHDSQDIFFSPHSPSTCLPLLQIFAQTFKVEWNYLISDNTSVSTNRVTNNVVFVFLFKIRFSFGLCQKKQEEKILNRKRKVERLLIEKKVNSLLTPFIWPIIAPLLASLFPSKIKFFGGSDKN